MSVPERRVFLGRASSLVERTRIFRVADGLEVDELDYFQIRRRRVLFDEVEMVTLHSARGGVLPWFCALLAVVVGLLGMLSYEEPGVQNTFLGTALALAGLTAVAALVPVWTVTVFGRRTRARVQLRGRPGKARALYADVCRDAAGAQHILTP